MVMSKIDLNIIPALSQAQRDALKEDARRYPGIIVQPPQPWSPEVQAKLAERRKARLAALSLQERADLEDFQRLPLGEQERQLRYLQVQRFRQEVAAAVARRNEAGLDRDLAGATVINDAGTPPDTGDGEKVVPFKRPPEDPPPPPPEEESDGESTAEGPPVFSDEGLALRFAAKHKADLRYVAAWGQWFVYDGKRWKRDSVLHAYDLVRKVCRAASQARRRLRKDKDKGRSAQSIASASTVAAVERLARADRRLAATIEQWDADPMLINTPDGVVDLRAGKLRRHRATDYMTMITAVGSRGDCPKWKAFLKRITGGDEALVAYLRRVMGYCLTGDTGEQAMFFGYGVGANGKGVLLHTVGRVLGDYCKTAAIETFTESKTDRHPTELARLHSARLVIATETESGRNWAESRIKMLTGGDTVTAHFMRQDDFEYVPKFKLFFTGNHKPGLRSVGEAMRRRMHMIPFAVIIPKDERDPHFVDRLKDEWPGILAWAIEGCLDWHERGSLAEPEAVSKETDAYFEAQDSFSQWIDECCDRDPNAWDRSTPLFRSWKEWAENAGVRYGSVQDFRERMERAGFMWRRHEKAKGYEGLRLKVEGRWDDRE
jgi:putative DNA primase/helicase